jgi:hypothetical protein
MIGRTAELPRTDRAGYGGIWTGSHSSLRRGSGAASRGVLALERLLAGKPAESLSRGKRRASRGKRGGAAPSRLREPGLGGGLRVRGSTRQSANPA